jgi:alkylation response protein AidB-like acyl-CoA dehydrogenase
MATIPTTPPFDAAMDRARALARTLSDRSAEIETTRRLPDDVLAELVAAGCFRILLPRSHGGSEATLVEALGLCELLASADPATGWTIMIGASGWCDLASLPRSTFDALFTPDSEVLVAGAIAPTGSITRIAGGYELTGRWGYASGCEHATHFFANAIEGFVDGHPKMRVAVLPAADVMIEDTWDVIGLRGTGSHHFSVSGAIVEPERTFVPLVDPPCLDTPIARIPTPAVFAAGIAAVAIGAARGALDAVRDTAQRKVPLLAAGTLATDPLFHHDLARADATLTAAWSALRETTADLWDQAVAGDHPTLEQRARVRAAATWATEAALATAEFAYRSGGGPAVYNDSPLQRRLRDVHAMAQHFLVRPNTFVSAGQVLAGQGLTTLVF